MLHLRFFAVGSVLLVEPIAKPVDQFPDHLYHLLSRLCFVLTEDSSVMVYAMRHRAVHSAYVYYGWLTSTIKECSPREYTHKSHASV